MAKKKRRRQKRPLAPPVHSAPQTTPSPVGPPQPEPGATRPSAPTPPTTEPAQGGPPPTVRARETARRRDLARRRRGRNRTYLIVGIVVLLIAGLVVGRQLLNRRTAAEFDRAVAAAGCGDLQVMGTGPGDRRHLAQGERVDYETSPPTHGPHSPQALPAGIYDEPLSDDPTDSGTIYQAVHSLEHGYVIVWHDGLTETEQSSLDRRYRNEDKVIVVPHPDLEGENRMALTAWGRLLNCSDPSFRAIDAFVDRFREARTAPEPEAP